MADNALQLSDEEFMKQDPATFLAGAEDDTPQEVDTLDQEMDSVDTSQKEESTDDVASKEDSEAQEQTATDVKDEEVGDLDGDTQTELEPSSEIYGSESFDTSEDDPSDTDGDSQEPTGFDYESAYKKVTEPFKANGTEMRITDPDDIVSLMQMGANYQKKMAQLKPNLKVVKMLDKAGLLDEGKLNNLIDLSKKDPKAVAKLIEESGLDPLDIDTEVKSDYQPTDYSVTDKEYNLDQVLDEIKDTATFTRTIDVLTKEWDSGSKATISDNPEIISVINTHMGNGVFDKVNEVLQQEKTLGKLAGVSDVQAYHNIAEYMASKGMLTPGNSQATAPTVSTETEDQTQANAERNKKRKAAASVKQTKTETKNQETDFLGLSDDEFMKKFASR
tara:strand:+ start:2721 stop:3890 length:1170 start_codon:yes stop_codon:yes gene_type:complete